jgi:hypothetical protein
MEIETIRKSSKKSAKSLSFDKRLVLNRFILSLFKADDFDSFVQLMKRSELEGLDGDNISYFHHHITAVVVEREGLSNEMLRQYDENIIRHTMHISRKREQPLKWKYFQYLSLLFTEIYLDRYFTNREEFLLELNNFATNLNVTQAVGIDAYTESDLRKLAFWNATGSGKTLLMHVNMLQYMHYHELHQKQNPINRVILITPKEDLSIQHLREFEQSGLQAELFDKELSLFSSQSISIINIQRIKEDAKDKTVAVDMFEGNNLVLVDEGHRGASGDEWRTMRNRLSEEGFAFEYSATFGQAVSGKKDLEQEYGKCILFNYSYKYFYKDGFGKDYHILNLEDDTDIEIRRMYLMACLVSFYQQLKLYQDKEQEYHKFLLEKPLCVFVGGKVNAVRKVRGLEVSDVTDILLFISEFASDQSKFTDILKRLLSGSPGLRDSKQREVFRNAFGYINHIGISPEELYRDMLSTVFNCTHTDVKLHVVNLKGVDSEIALQLGDNDPFGVINVGDAAALCKLCESYPQLHVTDKQFVESLFHQLDNRDSKITMLIGSKKFTEGWSSWRVSTMGLLNIGTNEGSEIIQLFGRGVRLKGYGFSLKRSVALNIPELRVPEFMETIETLNIFGVHADYMQQFKEYLEDEGLQTEDDKETVKLKVIKNYTRRNLNLSTLTIPEHVDFKRKGNKPLLESVNQEVDLGKVIVNWYPKIQHTDSRQKNQRALAIPDVMYEGKLESKHIAFIDMEQVYFELQRFKNERAWFNLQLSQEKITELLNQPDWYTLYIPKEELEFTSFERVRRWQEIAVALLKKYCQQYYNYRKKEYEAPFTQYRFLNEDDSNFINEYRVTYNAVEEPVLAQKLSTLKRSLESEDVPSFNFAGLETVEFEQHLYHPLLFTQGNIVQVSPAPLNKGEHQFVSDLRRYYQSNRSIFSDKELYLLRNQSKRGIGFFEAGNFYPDFMLWILYGGKQYVTFIDPKGIRQLSYSDKKIQFFRTIKEKEVSLKDDSIVLNSFIISNTKYVDLINWGTVLNKEALEESNILFQVEDEHTYIAKMMRKILV